MGVSMTARVLVGVRLAPRTESIQRTKYNEDTGTAYLATEERKFFVIEGTDIEIQQTDDLLDREDGELTIACAGDGDRGTWFLGVDLAKTGSLSWRALGQRQEIGVDALYASVVELLRQRVRYDGPVAVFLIGEMDY